MLQQYEDLETQGQSQDLVSDPYDEHKKDDSRSNDAAVVASENDVDSENDLDLIIERRLIPDDDPGDMMNHIRSLRKSIGSLQRDSETSASYDRASCVATNEIKQKTQKVNKVNTEFCSEHQPLLRTSTSGSSTKAQALWRLVRDHRLSLTLGWTVSNNEEAARHRASRSRQLASEIHRQLEYPLTQCLLGIFLYLMIAIAAYSYVFEKWTIIDSVYFACCTFTTLGYGDLVPSTEASRLFTAFFALAGVACLGLALSVLGSNLLNAHDRAVDKARKLSQYRVMSVFASSKSLQYRENVRDDIGKAKRSVFSLFLVVFFSTLFLVTCWVIATESGWSFITSLYFAIITACTIGYGDIYPDSQTERLLAVLYIPLAVAAMAKWLGFIAETMIKRRHAEMLGLEEQKHELTKELIEIMDDNGNGEVTFGEYLQFMLLAMGKTDAELVRDLRKQFKNMDVDGTGVLRKEDLIIVARRKMKSPRRKLQLAAYKKHLLSARKNALQKETTRER